MNLPNIPYESTPISPMNPPHLTNVPETPLSVAVSLESDRCRRVILALVSGGALLDFRTKKGLTALHKAVMLGHLEAVKVRKG
jgi:SH3/ankyrin repeat-containing protein